MVLEYSIKQLIEQYRQGESFRELQTALSKNVHVEEFSASVVSVAMATLFDEYQAVLCLVNDEETAIYYQNDLRNLLPEQTVFFFPSSEGNRSSHLDTTNKVLRNEAINHLTQEKPTIVVATIEALAEAVPSFQSFKQVTFSMTVGESLNYDALLRFLDDHHFERTDFVFQPGEFSTRGAIIDVFSFNSEYPFRLVLDDDVLEHIRLFDIDSQESVEELQSVSVIPRLDITEVDTTSFLHYFPKDSLLVAQDLPMLFEYIAQNREKAVPEDDVKRALLDWHIMEFGGHYLFRDVVSISFGTQPQKQFHKNINLLMEDFSQRHQEGYQLLFAAENKKQYERILAVLEEQHLEVELYYLPIGLHEGFIDNRQKISLYTDHQIFERYYKPVKPVIKRQYINRQLKELENLKPGDYVVHVDYGIGRFAGLEKIENNGKEQEALKILYKDNDILYISIHSLYKLSKYKSNEGIPPTVHKLGGKTWTQLKEKAKKRVKDIAKDLIELYAKRKMAKGFRFSPDSYLQKELEASFFYEDTPDQQTASEAVKRDMEQDSPTDRLVCGDVGFGKTEIAIRAAFKAVTDGKQVAVLVPTTILALQHYKTFSSRLENFPCTVDYLNRFKSKQQQTETLKRLKEGQVDIIIGTHRLVSKDVKFKDLGLLIIDEEQKFGVAIKEKLRQIKHNVDTLTLTATPIPRTLQFSLMGVRDISLITTPPPNRLPIHTEIHGFDIDFIKQVILYEINRKGQVFFVNNNIKNIYEIERMLKNAIKGVRIAVAHGQMRGEALERIMRDFIEGEYDVLISTSIIESGLDIPNANTIIINNANHFGLSDLHQMRGRVGRTNIKAFCYLITPPMSTLPLDARKRLNALVEFSELGSGFNIALQDLEIRGAGSLFGGEQSGFINEMGIETFQKVLNEAIRELRYERNELNDDEAIENEEAWTTDCQIDTDLPVLFPESYIESPKERIRLYSELNKITSMEQLNAFKNKLIDRFGKLPEESYNLFDLVQLKLVAMPLGIEKIILKNKIFKAVFVANPAFYQSDLFGKLLAFLQTEKGRFYTLADYQQQAALKRSPITNITVVKADFEALMKIT